MATPKINGRRGAFQLLFGSAYIAISASYVLTPDAGGRTSTLGWINPYVPLEYLGMAWGFAGVVAVVSCVLPRPRDRYAFMALTLVPILWGFLYLIGWFVGDAPTGYMGTIVYGLMAGAVMVVSGMSGDRDRDHRQIVGVIS
ncbi:hypothetical protein D6T65_04960 [Arthrobacter frigidicola]|nr:hypothetical protein D6T65_04960 [Arthrobacter frigidicola]